MLRNAFPLSRLGFSFLCNLIVIDISKQSEWVEMGNTIFEQEQGLRCYIFIYILIL